MDRLASCPAQGGKPPRPRRCRDVLRAHGELSPQAAAHISDQEVAPSEEVEYLAG